MRTEQDILYEKLTYYNGPCNYSLPPLLLSPILSQMWIMASSIKAKVPARRLQFMPVDLHLLAQHILQYLYCSDLPHCACPGATEQTPATKKGRTGLLPSSSVLVSGPPTMKGGTPAPSSSRGHMKYHFDVTRLIRQWKREQNMAHPPLLPPSPQSEAIHRTHIHLSIC